MLMIKPNQEVTRQSLAAIPTPQATRSWRPIPHIDVVETVLERAQTHGLQVHRERYSVQDGALYPHPGMKVDVPGGRLFATLDFEPIKGLDFPSGCRPSAGIRNSTDQSHALALLAGTRVVVCSNGMLVGEHIVKRKHTSGINLREAVDKALGAFLDSMRDFAELHDRLRNTRLSTIRAHSLVVEAARAGAYSSSDVLPIVEEWEKPRHVVFKERTAWSLYNAVTERLKVKSPGQQSDAFKALNSVLLPLVN